MRRREVYGRAELFGRKFTPIYRLIYRRLDRIISSFDASDLLPVANNASVCSCFIRV